MRVLQLPSWYLPEGGHFCLHQSQALQEAGVEVHMLANVILTWKKYKLSLLKFPLRPFFILENDIPTYRYYSWKYPRVERINTEKWAKKTLQLFEDYKKKHGLPDVIHAHSSMFAGYVAALIKKKYGVPYVITEHKGIFSSNCNYATYLLKEKYFPYIREAFSNADVIIPVSSQLIPKIKSFCTTDADNFHCISNIVDTDFFSLNKKNYDGTDFILVSVNGFYYEKGYDILLPAFDALCEKNANVQLRIVGENFDKKKFKQIFEDIRHKNKISFTGELDREGVRQELWNANAFVIASRIESQSVATLEALSCGLPVVATAVIPEEMVNINSGYRVAIENKEELTKALSLMLENYDSFSSAKISEMTNALANKEFVVKELIEAYKTAMKD